MISINLHDYRYELTKVEIQKRAVKAAWILMGSLVVIGLYWFQQQLKVDGLTAEIKQVEAQVQGLSKDYDAIQKVIGKQKRVEQIIAGIGSLRNKQLQASQILADLNFEVPNEIWLTQVTQRTMGDILKARAPVVFIGDPEKLAKKSRKNVKPGEESYEFIEIAGKAFGSFGDRSVVEYIRYLKTIPYFEKVFLDNTSFTLLGTFPVREFRIYCYMPTQKGKKA